MLLDRVLVLSSVQTFRPSPSPPPPHQPRKRYGLHWALIQGDRKRGAKGGRANVRGERDLTSAAPAGVCSACESVCGVCIIQLKLSLTSVWISKGIRSGSGYV